MFNTSFVGPTLWAGSLAECGLRTKWAEVEEYLDVSMASNSESCPDARGADTSVAESTGSGGLLLKPGLGPGVAAYGGEVDVQRHAEEAELVEADEDQHREEADLGGGRSEEIVMGIGMHEGGSCRRSGSWEVVQKTRLG